MPINILVDFVLNQSLSFLYMASKIGYQIGIPEEIKKFYKTKADILFKSAKDPARGDIQQTDKGYSDLSNDKLPNSMNFEALIITMAVIGGIILLALTVCICCCCCCKNKKSKYAKEDAKMERKTEERKAKQSEKRAERKARTDEIRRKYGLIKEDNPYQRFDEA
ncbi:hypothetical protein KUTeg_011429 [Tegillarca granosa]|uniref:PTTG1IP n=1 Tax=Tegillarca granosa TaxID=220873 RepID=A0ABQ9F0S3_TEGGR|nr:hypothetical protein KUTeg_011429 [Tegillarca granosa]